MMAFIRWKTNKYGIRQAYLVHSYRDEQGRPRHKTLAYLGGQGEITDSQLTQLQQQHGQLSINWAAIKSSPHPSPKTDVSQLSDEELARQLPMIRKEHGLSRQAMGRKLLALGVPPVRMYRETVPFSTGVYVSLEDDWSRERPYQMYQAALPTVAPFLRQVFSGSAQQ